MDRPTKSECLDTFGPIQHYTNQINHCPEAFVVNYYTDSESNQTAEEESSGEMIPICQTANYQVPVASDAMQAPMLELHQDVRTSQACYDPSNHILAADVRETPFVISHPQLYAFGKLVVTFTNHYDKTGQLIELANRGPNCCSRDDEVFLRIRGETGSCKSEQFESKLRRPVAIQSNTLVEYQVPAVVNQEYLSQLTIFLDFKHSTSCYKKSNQSCFQIQRNTSKSPIFRGHFYLVNQTGQCTKPLIVLIKVVRNVTREFEKMTKAFLPQPKPKSEDDRTDCSHKVLPKVKYAENDDFYAIAVSKHHPKDVQFWKGQIDYFSQASPENFQSYGSDVAAIFQKHL